MAESALRNISPTWWKDIKPQAPQKPVGQQMSDVLGGVALATAPIPVVGDVAGAVSDAAMYAAYPEERTMLNAGLSLAGLLPFVPGAAGVRTAADALDMSQAGSVVDTGYRGLHQAPSISGANSLDNLADIYGDDIYSPNALRYFGMGDEFRKADMESLSAISRAKGKPNAMVTVYRAVPNFKTSAQKASELSEDMAQFLKRGRVPSRSAVSGLDGSKWYDWAYDERNRLSQIADNIPDAANQINPSDWVSLSKDYAAKHGQSALEGNYKILSKKVKASELATTGDALSEWGWNPPTK
jgi:hypothetical protein